MPRIDYSFENRENVLANLLASGKVVVEDVTIDLDEEGVPQTSYCMVEDAPEPQPDLLAEADARILDLEYALCLAEGGI